MSEFPRPKRKTDTLSKSEDTVKRTKRETAQEYVASAREIQQAARDSHFPQVLSDALQKEIKDFLWSVEPRIVKFGRFKVDLTSRPQRAWGIPNPDGDLPLYVYGQAKESYAEVEHMPAVLYEAAQFLEQRFAHPPGYLNLAFATFYGNGSEHHIPPHQDKAVAKESEGRVEATAPIYNLSFGAARSFVFAGLGILPLWGAKKGGKEMDYGPYTVKKILMECGDLVVLTPFLNENTAHMIPKEDAMGMRISLVFRHCTKRYLSKDKRSYYTMVFNKKTREWQRGAAHALA